MDTQACPFEELVDDVAREPRDEDDREDEQSGEDNLQHVLSLAPLVRLGWRRTSTDSPLPNPADKALADGALRVPKSRLKPQV